MLQEDITILSLAARNSGIVNGMRSTYLKRDVSNSRLIYARFQELRTAIQDGGTFFLKDV